MKLKNAFSLAEVLIAIAIISVILIMCFSITNQGLDRAYTRYIYTGYKGLSDAIKEASANNIEMVRESAAGRLKSMRIRNEYVEYICNLFNGTINGNNALYCSTPNGIDYLFANNSPLDAIKVTMYVPSRKKEANKTKDSIDFYYLFTRPPYVLIPTSGGDINLLERPDLLPFYVDDGNTGRVVNDPVMGEMYVAKQYLSASEAICSVYGKITSPINTSPASSRRPVTIINCPDDVTRRFGIVKYENPQKAW